MDTIKTGQPEKQKQRAIVILAMAAAVLGAALLVDKNALTTQLETIIGIFTLGSLAIAWRDVSGVDKAAEQSSANHYIAVRKLFEYSLQLLAVGFLWTLALLGTAAYQTIWPVEVAFLLTCVYAAFSWHRSKQKAKVQAA